MPAVDEVMAELERLGTAQNRKVYVRHGAREPLFGVSYKDLGVLAKRLGREHDLACELWSSANHDARVLATRLADPSQLSAELAEAWLADVDNHVLLDVVVSALAASPDGVRLAASWRERDAEWPSAAGWALTAALALRPGALSDGDCEALLGGVEARIADAPNRTRHELNGALIAIGSRGGALEQRAREAAARIGPVHVDHGQTGCKTPEALAYLDRIAARRASKAGGRRAASGR